MKTPLLATVLLASTALAGTANAADSVTTLDAITVTATRSATAAFAVPKQVDVIGGEQSALKSASTIGDMFKDVAALEAYGSARRSGQVPSMRGYDDDGLLVLVDGVRQNFNSEHDGRFFLDPSLVKRVEVVRGPTSTLYGSGALGGVVSFETVDAADLATDEDPSGVRISAGTQSANDEYSVTTTGFMLQDKFDVVGSLTTRQSGSVRLGDGNELFTNNDVLSGLFKINYLANDLHSLGFQLKGYRDDSLEPNNPQTGVASPLAPQIVDKEAESYTAQLHHDYENTDHAWLNRLNTKLYVTNSSVEETVLVATNTNAAGDKLSRELMTYGINVDAGTDFVTGSAKHALAYGVEAYRDDQDGGDTGNPTRGGVPDAEAEFMGAYVQNTITLDGPGGMPGTVTLIPSARYDSYESDDANGNSNDESAFSPQLGLSYQPTGWLNLFGNAGKAFRSPDLTEIYSTGRHFAIGPYVNNFIPNPNLKPEENFTYEFGAKLRGDGLLTEKDAASFSASRFITSADNYIDAAVTGLNVPGVCFSPAAPPTCSAGTTQSVNVASASLWGYEASAEYDHPMFNLRTSLSYVTGKDDNSGAYLTNITPLTVVNNATFKLPEYDAALSARFTVAEGHDKTQDPAAVRDGYGVLDLYADWTPAKLGGARDVSFRIGVDNVLDHEYERVFGQSLEAGQNYYVRAALTW